MDDDEYLRRFENQSLPRAQWNHRAHLKVAYLYLTRGPFDEALGQIRAGIRAYNAAQAIADSPTGGYHETMTLAWVRLVQAALRGSGPAASADAFFEAQGQLTEKHRLRCFYSVERLMSPEAKAAFVTPDLAPLPPPSGL